MFSKTYFPPDYFESRYFVNDFVNPISPYADIAVFSLELNRTGEMDLEIQTQIEQIMSINRQVEDTLDVDRQLEFTVER
jgi:hypothetical protein